MKNYSPKLAAQLTVRRNTQHGTSRHKLPETASIVRSVLTEKAHVSALTVFAKGLLKLNGRHLKNVTRPESVDYLYSIAKTRRQSTVSLTRQALNLHIFRNDPLPFVQSEIPTEPKNRAYSRRQIELLTASAEADLALSIKLAENAGLRAMELVTIGKPTDLMPSNRGWNKSRFSGRAGDVEYVVHGKGGLKREVRLHAELALELENTRRQEPMRVSNRGAHLISHYHLLGGQQFSIRFTQLSMKVLGFTFGAHGLRHSFGQRRRNEFLRCGFSMKEAVPMLSQEMGHFASKNTLAYLRDCSSGKKTS